MVFVGMLIVAIGWLGIGQLFRMGLAYKAGCEQKKVDEFFAKHANEHGDIPYPHYSTWRKGSENAREWYTLTESWMLIAWPLLIVITPFYFASVTYTRLHEKFKWDDTPLIDRIYDLGRKKGC